MDELTKWDGLEEFCDGIGGQTKEMTRSIGPYQDFGCQLDDKELFFNDRHPKTSEEPNNGVFVTVREEGETDTFRAEDYVKRKDTIIFTTPPNRREVTTSVSN